MSESQELLSDMIVKLKQQRDELALKIHLGKQDAKDEWERVRAKLDQLADDYEPVTDAARESASKVFDSMKDVASEIKASFDRIRESLKS